MQQVLYDELELIEEVHWWLTTRRRIFLYFIRRAANDLMWPLVLDCGCGTGRLVKHLSAVARTVGVDMSRRGLHGSRNHEEMFVQAKVEELPFQANSFDIICALDVLEHLHDDAAAVKQMHSLLKPGGRLLLSVPAYRFLWNTQDELAEHKRRYSLSQLLSLLQSSHFVVEKATYFNTLLFPLMIAVRLVRNAQAAIMKVPLRSDFALPKPGLINALLRSIFCTELTLLKRVNFPFGGSILCIAKRR